MIRKITRKKLQCFINKIEWGKVGLNIGSCDNVLKREDTTIVNVDILFNRQLDVVGDIFKLPFKSESFDSVLCSEVLEHTKDPKQAVKEIYRVLKKNGKLYITTRLLFPLHDAPGDYHRFTEYNLREIANSFSNLKITYETGPFSTIGVLMQRIVFQTDMYLKYLTKPILLLLAFIFSKMDFLCKKCFGDVSKKTEVNNFMSSGIYLYAEKK
ncbi:MAG: methyltransferase domain-containing protein [Candidatus Auribacterota bacterium]|nr:methyltransferase domain-containing protein [Candidatus Auribacterota bacterium]